MQYRPTFAEQDRIMAARQAKRVECVERLSKILAKEFDFDELRFMWNFEGNAILIESFELARTRVKK
jgi:hypothetical protein